MKEITLKNGRRYKIEDTGHPYVGGEYPSGGYIIYTWSTVSNQWLFVDNAPNQACMGHFLSLAEKLSPLDEK